MNNLEYKIVRSANRRKLTITVERDREIIVHAPTDTSEETVHRLVDTKRQWIFEKLHHSQKYQDRVHPPGKEVVNGESAPYLGSDYRIEVSDTVSGEVEFDRLFLVPVSRRDKRREALKSWYIARAKEIILPRVTEVARELGVTFKAAKIVDKRYRWGSCTLTSNVNFNWRLIKAPMFVIDYVVVHELAHLLENNHTARFWSIVRASSPSMEKAKSWLKEHGQILEERL
jgi:predicted metal-dependent hydrolase